MSLIYTMFDAAGRFTKVLECGDPAMVALNTEPDETAVEGAYTAAHCLLAGEVEERPVFALSHPGSVLAGAVFRVDDIPAGTTVTGPNFSEVVDDGFIEWTSMEPGTYRIAFENFPYMEHSINAEFTSA